jgi:hypothetical protein
LLFIFPASGQFTSNLVWRKAGGKIMGTHLLTFQFMVQDVIKTASRSKEKVYHSKKSRKGRESLESHNNQ